MRFFKQLERENRVNLIRCAVSALLIAVAFAVRAAVNGTDLSDTAKTVISLLLFAVPYALIGYDVVWEALKGIFHGELLDEHFLMFIATVGAFAIGEYPEAVAVMLFYQVGELLQDVAMDRSRESIHALMELKPDKARVLRDGTEIELPPEEVLAGEIITVRPGERIPLDGVITEGRTTLDTSALTGESRPKDAGVSENVLSGCVNLTAMIRVRVSGVYGESTVAKILELAENAAGNKARAENIVRRFARIYTPCVVGAALLLAAVPPIFGGEFRVWLGRALMFLVVSCPCALVISVPLSFFSGMGAASRKGILIKGAYCMETLAKTGSVVFDKTGTLTKGSFSVSAVHANGMSPETLLDIAACAESFSDHPIAGSIIRAHGGHIDKSRISEVNEIAGMGIKAVIDGKTILAGNDKLVGCPSGKCSECTHTGTVIHISSDGEYCGHIVISDEIKPDSADAVNEIRSIGAERIVMLTGDGEEVARETAETLGITEYFCSLLPADKVSKVAEIRACGGGTTVFVGDGINDAPALASADVGIAMGISGSDAAIETADVVIMDDSVGKVAKAITISRRTVNIVKQNIAFSLAVKIAVMLTGALGITNMWWAVFGDVGVTVLAVLNATRMMISDEKRKKRE